MIKKSTSDMEIKAVFKDDNEVILARFEEVKERANALDAERDRLRQYIQERIPNGVYGSRQLVKTEGTPRFSSTTEGNAMLQYGLIIEPANLVKLPKKEEMVQVVSLETGKPLYNGKLLVNANLYNKRPPTMVKITEVDTCS